MLHYLNFISRKIVVNIIIELKSNRNSELQEHTKVQLKKLTIEKKNQRVDYKRSLFLYQSYVNKIIIINNYNYINGIRRM